MTRHTLKTARLFSFLIHLGYLLMVVLLVTTNNWMLAFAGLIVALAGFAMTGQAALCPKCSGKLLNGGPGIAGVANLLKLTAGKAIVCHDCDYHTEAADYS